MSTIIGWDLGGANLKVAVIREGALADARQIPCPILPDRSKFDQALATAIHALAIEAEAPVLHAVTMTGELSDVFESRTEGVGYLIALMERATEAPLMIWAGERGLRTPDEAKATPYAVASANWLATASLTAQGAGNGLLFDIGTTTTDLIPFRTGTLAMRGETDAARLTEGELVYTGIVRTPVMAISRKAPFQGRSQGVAAEKFATLADVYRLTGDLPDDADPYPSADGRGKSVAESAARLARMLGRDRDDAPMSEWVQLARWFAERHLEQITREAEALLAREDLGPDAAIVGAGCGRFLASRVARSVSRPYREFGDIAGVSTPLRNIAAICAPAVSVALLAATDRAISAL